jgi:hypothetical protein
MQIDPITSASILNYIQDQCENGAVITIGKDFIAVGGKRLWSIRGADVNSSGYETFNECFERWANAIEYLDERKMNG